MTAPTEGAPDGSIPVVHVLGPGGGGRRPGDAGGHAGVHAAGRRPRGRDGGERHVRLRRRAPRRRRRNRPPPGRRGDGHDRRAVRGGEGAHRRLLHHRGGRSGRGAHVGPQGRRGDPASHRGASVPSDGPRPSLMRVVAATDAEAIERVFRDAYGQAVATLVRTFGDISLAEDAVQDAFVVASRRWPEDGVPPNPAGWIVTTARRRAIDDLRRSARGRELADQLRPIMTTSDAPENGATADRPVPDDQLRLIFTCCHPALRMEHRVALTLRLLGGLSVEEVARSFLASEPAMAKRLVRAKYKIKAARIAYRVPE